jgi:hypothetical protein
MRTAGGGAGLLRPPGRTELPLSPRSLDERCSVAPVAPGVRWTRIVRDGGPWRGEHADRCTRCEGVGAPAESCLGMRARPSAVSPRLRAVAA